MVLGQRRTAVLNGRYAEKEPNGQQGYCPWTAIEARERPERADVRARRVEHDCSKLSAATPPLHD